MVQKIQSTLRSSFRSLLTERTRTIFTVLFALTSIIPLLILILLIAQYILPLLTENQVQQLTKPVQGGMVAILLISFLCFLLIARMVAYLERAANLLRSKSTQFNIIGSRSGQAKGNGSAVFNHEENEVLSLVHSFNILFNQALHNETEYKRLRNILYNLIAVGVEFSSELEFDNLFSMIISRVTKVMAAERTSLYVIDWERSELWTKVAEGVGQIRLPIGEGISGRVAESGIIINVEDAWKLPYFNRAFDKKNRFRTRSVLCVPIKNLKGERIGVLQVINKQDKVQFDYEDEILLKALAAQIGIALENSFLLEEIRLSFESAINTLSATVDARHPLTAGHSERVKEYSLLIARKMGMSEKEIESLKLAALLHDIGKIGIRDTILLKDGVFSPSERAEMNTHAKKTKIILENFHFPSDLRDVPDIAAHHHEKINGEGYPDGLKGEQLHIGSRIMAVADVFDALTSKRDYPKYTEGETLNKDPMPVMQALSILRTDAGTHFEPDVVEAFIECVPDALEKYRGSHFNWKYVEEALAGLAREQDAAAEEAN
ncbi:MAG: HD domain-containing protein [Deltaproteobacteria bacterium]|nr:HD domain-containing protein [Deltaproteobacteria bacterium]